MKTTMEAEALFTSSNSIAKRIESLIRGASRSVDCALYRLNHPALIAALVEAASRGVRVRLLLDLGKVSEGSSPQGLLREETLSCRLLSGPKNAKSKMHHKFAILDRQTALTGSYNWTLESEHDNFENLVILREAGVVDAYAREFESLWARAPQDKVFAR